MSRQRDSAEMAVYVRFFLGLYFLGVLSIVCAQETCTFLHLDDDTNTTRVIFGTDFDLSPSVARSGQDIDVIPGLTVNAPEAHLST